MRRLLLGIVLWAASVLSQDGPPLVSCEKGKSFFQSPTLSAAGQQAYATTEARQDSKWGCANTARLYVAGRGQPFRLVYTITPLREDEGTADSLLPIAWSHDGRWLAIEGLYTTHSPTDWAALGLLLYDSRAGKAKEVDSDFSNAVSKALHRNCEVLPRKVQGFTSTGEVALSLGDRYDEEGNSRPCVGNDSTWLFNPETLSLKTTRSLV